MTDYVPWWTPGLQPMPMAQYFTSVERALAALSGDMPIGGEEAAVVAAVVTATEIVEAVVLALASAVASK